MSERSVVDNPAASRFEILVDGRLAGFADYRPEGTATALTHTVVQPEHEGQGVGAALARGALDAVRGNGGAVLPYCPFLRSWIQRHPDYLDLVPTDRRAEFALTPGDQPPDRL